MRRKQTIRRRSARITPGAIEARRRNLELQDAVKECDAKRDAAGRNAWKGGEDYTEYHKRVPPCSEACACQAAWLAWHEMVRELGVKRPWDFNSDTETPWADLLAEVDQLVEESRAESAEPTV